MFKKSIAMYVVFCMLLGFILGGTYFTKVSAAVQATYYVSASAPDDSGDGSILHPWKTITHARDVVRTLNGNMTGDIYVYIRAGDYFTSSAINFGPADSGTNGYKIYYAGYPGDDMPRIIGGQALTGWTPDSGGIYKVNVGTSWTFNRLYENDVPGVVARYPNTGYIQTAGAGADPLTQIKFNAGDLPSFDYTKTPAQIHTVYIDSYSQTYPITNIDWTTRTITASDPCDDWLTLASNAKFYVQGAKEFLDQPGEFFLDHSAGWLYYRPRNASITDGQIIAPKVMSIFKLTGTGSSAKVHDITFTGLNIEDTDCGSKLPIFENSSYFSRDALVDLQDANNITVTKCKLYNAGTNAVHLKGSTTTTTNCLITDNWIKNSGTYGINMLDSGSNHITIDNNLIENSGTANSYSSAFSNYCNQYVDFTHNKIDGEPCFAVRAFDAESGDHNHNTVKYNEITNCVLEATDIGPIDTYRVTGTNNEISYNFIHDCGNTIARQSGVSGIYLDDMSCNFLVKNNIIKNIKSASDLYLIYAKGEHNIIDNNIIYQDSDLAVYDTVGLLNYDLDNPTEYPCQDITLTHNIYYVPGAEYFYLLWSWDGAWNSNTFTASNNNVFYFPSGMYTYGDTETYTYNGQQYQPVPGNGSFANWKTNFGNKFDQNSITGQDPLFTDPANNNFTLQAGSPALARGFVNIDQSQIGLRATFPWAQGTPTPTPTPIATPTPTPTPSATPTPTPTPTPIPGTNSISVSSTTAVSNNQLFDITASGTTDWVLPNVDEKSGGTAIAISGGSNYYQDSNYPRYSYTNGTTYTGSQTRRSYYRYDCPAVNISVPAGSGTVTLWLGTGTSANAWYNATLGSASTGNVSFGNRQQIVLNYTAASAGTLQVTMNKGSNTNAGVFAAAVSTGSGSVSGSLSGSVVQSSASVNLTSAGTADWAHWPGYDHKSAGGSKISNYTVVGTGTVNSYNDDLRAMSWTGGTPTASGSNNTNGSYISGVNNGFQFTVPADTTTRTLRVYVGGWSSGGKLQASLSDGSASDFVDASVSNGSDSYDAVYTLTYKAGSDNKTLTVKWIMNSGSGNVTLQAAALQ